MQFCYRHSIMGVVFGALERCGKRIPQEVLFEWIGVVENLKRQNAMTNKRLLEVVKWWQEKGRRSIILKGQANALMYPRPELRSPGDIDIWVEGQQNDIIKTVLTECPDAHYSIHHVKMPVFTDISVEVHYRPIYLINWFVDKRLQKYVSKIEDIQFGHTETFDGTRIGCLTDEFNVTYQLLHMYAHFFTTRNNFKQYIDYYYLLRRGLSSEQKDRIVSLLREFSVYKYARGMMWIMKEVLGLDASQLIVEPDEKVGKVILGESEHYGTYSTNKLKLVAQHFTSNIRLASMFPAQVLISPFFLIWHQWWKMKMKRELRIA